MSSPCCSQLFFLQRTEATNSQDVCRQYKKRFWGWEGEGQKQKSVCLAPKYSPLNSANIFFLYYVLFSLYVDAVRSQLSITILLYSQMRNLLLFLKTNFCHKWPRPPTWALGAKRQLPAEAPGAGWALSLSPTRRHSAQTLLPRNPASDNPSRRIPRRLFKTDLLSIALLHSAQHRWQYKAGLDRLISELGLLLRKALLDGKPKKKCFEIAG